MTKKLEDILNLPNVKEAFKEVDKKEKDKKLKDAGQENPSTKNLDPKTQANLQKSYAEFDKIAASLPQVKGLGEMSDLEMDKLAIEAEESYKNLMDLGMNVDSRYSRRIFEVASNFLKNAIDAKSSKIDRVEVENGGTTTQEVKAGQGRQQRRWSGGRKRRFCHI